MTTELTLCHLDAAQAGDLLDELVAVYLEVFADTGDEFFGEERYRRQLGGHMSAPGWDVVTARHGAELVGYAYGFPLPERSRWWEGLRTEVPTGFTTETGTRTFAISEIMVRAPWRRRGVARALHDELLAGRTEERATLLTEPDNVATQAACAQWGWRKVAELRPHWDGAPLYDAFILPLGPGRA